MMNKKERKEAAFSLMLDQIKLRYKKLENKENGFKNWIWNEIASIYSQSGLFIILNDKEEENDS